MPKLCAEPPSYDYVCEICSTVFIDYYFLCCHMRDCHDMIEISPRIFVPDIPAGPSREVSSDEQFRDLEPQVQSEPNQENIPPSPSSPVEQFANRRIMISIPGLIGEPARAQQRGRRSSIYPSLNILFDLEDIVDAMPDEPTERSTPPYPTYEDDGNTYGGWIVDENGNGSKQTSPPPYPTFKDDGNTNNLFLIKEEEEDDDDEEGFDSEGEGNE